MKKLMPFLAGLVFLAMTCPSKAQPADLTVAARHELAGMLENIVSADLGERVTVFNAWAFENSNRSLLFCGVANRLNGSMNFVVFMDGVSDDLVYTRVEAERMDSVGCGASGQKQLVGGVRPTLSALAFNNPRPETSSGRILTIPPEVRDDPACIQGITTAYAVNRGDMRPIERERRGAFDDLGQVRNLCFASTMQGLFNGRLNNILDGANAVAAQRELDALVLSTSRAFTGRR